MICPNAVTLCLISLTRNRAPKARFAGSCLRILPPVAYSPPFASDRRVQAKVSQQARSPVLQREGRLPALIMEMVDLGAKTVCILIAYELMN